MLRISKLTDYGVVLAAHLAARREAVSVRELAEHTGLPQPTVAKVLKALSKSGLVTSTRGVRGGYELLRRPEQVSVAEVIEALEGPISVTECADGTTEAGCARVGHCGAQTTWQRINARLLDALKGTTLAEMIAPSPSGSLVELGMPKLRASGE